MTIASQTRLFEWPRKREESESAHIARVVIAGVADQLIQARAVPDRLIRFGSDIAVRFMPEWELVAAGLEPAFWILPVVAGGLDRQVLVETLGEDVVEQDEAGRIWLNGGLAQPAYLAGFGSLSSGPSTPAQIGQPFALLLMERSQTGWALRIHVTAPVLWVHASARPVQGWPALDGWIRVARLVADRQADATLATSP